VQLKFEMSYDLGQHSQTFLFTPLDVKSQRFLCSVVDLPLVNEHKHNHSMSKQLGKPLQLHNIQGDGNCLFRALSYAVMASLSCFFKT
jgi:hypothetical protein